MRSNLGRTPAAFCFPSSPGSESTRASPLSESSPGSDRATCRLRGDGQALGKRGKSSAGIPWRHMPSYDNGGSLLGSGDLCASDSLQRPQRKAGEWTARLGSGAAVKELLQSVSERNFVSPFRSPEPSLLSTEQAPHMAPHEAWLDIIRKRHEVRRMVISSPKSPASTYRAMDSPNSSRPHTSRPDEDKRSPHFVFRQQKKGTGGVVPHTKDSCPFSRDDSEPESRAVQPATPGTRPKLQPAFVGREPSPSEKRGFGGEPMPEARRGFQFQEAREELNQKQDRDRRAAFEQLHVGPAGSDKAILAKDKQTVRGKQTPRTARGTISSRCLPIRPALSGSSSPTPSWR